MPFYDNFHFNLTRDFKISVAINKMLLNCKQATIITEKELCSLNRNTSLFNIIMN